MIFPNQSKPDIKWDLLKKVYVSDALDPSLCNSMIEYGMNSVRKSVSKYPGSFDVSFHSCLLEVEHEVHAALQETWKKVIDHLAFEIDFIEPYELKRYTTKDFFGKHIDNYYGLSTNLDRKITMSIQLTNPDEYSGGELQVVNSLFKGKQGSIVAFPSFFPHEVKPITDGTRWSLIGWAWGPYWR